MGIESIMRIVFALLVCASSLDAQTPAHDDSVLFRLPAVVVTVTRAPIRVLDAPLAISVVPARLFEDASGLRVDEALRNVPGVLAQSRSGGMDVRITVRGYGARGAGDRSNAGTTRGLRFLQDGFPETEPDGRTPFDLIELFAVQRVEVIRSNASALWGNAGGGLINFSTVPDASAPEHEAGVQLGDFGLRRAMGRFNAGLNGGRFYGTITRSDFDGWRAHSSGARSYANLGMLAGFGDATHLRIHAVTADNSFEIPGPLSLAEYGANPRAANATYLQRRERRRNRAGRLGVAVEHTLGTDRSITGSLYLNPKYLQRSERGTFRDFTRYHVGGSAVYRFKTLTVGIDEAYQDGAILFYSLHPDGSRGTVLRDNKREGANNFGIFAQGTVPVTRAIDATVGLRYDNITYYSDNYIDPRVNAQRTFERATPKIGLLHRLSKDHTVYANFGGGVEVPAGNETEPVGTFGTDTVTSLNPLLEPIRSNTIEVGTKRIYSGSGFVRAASYDVALYHTRVTNEIVPYRGGRFYFTAAKARRQGAEFGASIDSRAGLGLRGSLTLSDNRYRDYQVDSLHYGRAGRSADYSDNKVVGVPDLFYTLTAMYGLDRFQVELEAQHVGGYFADDANRVNVPGYTLLNASLGLSRALRIGALGLHARLRAENLGDARYVASSFLNPDVVANVPLAFEPGLPRHFVVTLSAMH